MGGKACSFCGGTPVVQASQEVAHYEDFPWREPDGFQAPLPWTYLCSICAPGAGGSVSQESDEG